MASRSNRASAVSLLAGCRITALSPSPSPVHPTGWTGSMRERERFLSALVRGGPLRCGGAARVRSARSLAGVRMPLSLDAGP